MRWPFKYSILGHLHVFFILIKTWWASGLEMPKLVSAIFSLAHKLMLAIIIDEVNKLFGTWWSNLTSSSSIWNWYSRSKEKVWDIECYLKRELLNEEKKGEQMWFLFCNLWALWCVNSIAAIALIHYRFLLQFWYGITDLLLQWCCHTRRFSSFLLNKWVSWILFLSLFLLYFVKTNRGRIIWFSMLYCCSLSGLNLVCMLVYCYNWFICWFKAV